MDPKKRSRVGGRVEIVREAVSRRKMRLSDVMSESFSKYLMELDGDFIAPTGARISRIEEAPTDAQIKARAVLIWQRKGSPRDQPPDQVRADYLNAKSELDDEEELVDARNASSPTNPENEEGMLGFQAGRAAAAPLPAAPPTTAPPPEPPASSGVDPGGDNDNTGDNDGPGSNTVDVDDDAGSPPGGGDASGFNDPTGGEGGVDTIKSNDEAPEAENPEVGTPEGEGNVQQPDDIQGTDTPTDDSSKDLGGPDEFDEKNRAFTSYIDSLINGTQPVTGGGDNLAEVSRRSTSLIEAVYGSRKIEIVNYKRSR